jgi:nitrite reductase/ring-hydroxylating ferredoxin subunit
MLQLCRVADLPEEGARGFQLPQASLLVVRTRGGIRVFLNRCPHLGVPLQWQRDRFLDAEGMFIRCATHGALFEKDSGLCILGPCRGDSLWQIDCTLDEDRILIDDQELPARTLRSE